MASDEPDNEAIDEARRLLHNVRGASSMIGLVPLSAIARRAERALEAVLAGRLAYGVRTRGALLRVLELLSGYLENEEAIALEDDRVVREAVAVFRQLEGLQPLGPEADAEVANLLVEAGGSRDEPGAECRDEGGRGRGGCG